MTQIKSKKQKKEALELPVASGAVQICACSFNRQS